MAAYLLDFRISIDRSWTVFTRYGRRVAVIFPLKSAFEYIIVVELAYYQVLNVD